MDAALEVRAISLAERFSSTSRFTSIARAINHFESAESRSEVQASVYAHHGRAFMGCKSPVRDWESQGDQYTK